MTACDDGSGNGENGGNGGGDGLSRDSRLVGKWQPDWDPSRSFTLNADGSTISNIQYTTYTWSTSGNTLTTVMGAAGSSITFEAIATYVISEDGQTLTISGSHGAQAYMPVGTYIKQVDED